MMNPGVVGRYDWLLKYKHTCIICTCVCVHAKTINISSLVVQAHSSLYLSKMSSYSSPNVQTTTLVNYAIQLSLLNFYIFNANLSLML